MAGIATAGAPSSDVLTVGGVAAERVIIYGPDGNVLFPSAIAAADAMANPTVPQVLAYTMAFNNITWDRLANNSLPNISRTTQPFALMVANPGEWSVSHVPAANTQATASKAAAAAGRSHVLRALAFTVTTDAAATAISLIVNVIDGASAGTNYLWRGRLSVSAVAGEKSLIVLSGLNIFGTAATAMTIEFAVAGGAGTYETVSMSGYTTI